MNKLILLCLLSCSSSLEAQQTDFADVNFHRADSVAAHHHGKTLHNLPLLAYQLTEGLPTEVEQFRAIYTWVCTNIAGDHDAFQRNFRKRHRFRNDSLSLALWNKNFSEDVFEKLLKKQETVCTGYAYLIKELATLAGIHCEIIDGYGRTPRANIGTATAPNHSWNAVQLNQRWYLCDATWSSGYTRLPDNVYVPDYQDGYFLADPALFVRNHYPLNTDWLLMNQPLSFEDFLQAPLIYKDAFTHHLEPVSPGLMKIRLRKNEVLQLQLQAPDSTGLSELQLEIHWKGSIRREQPDTILSETGLVEMRYQFEKRGLFDVHILLGDAYIASYVVEVVKEN